MKTKTGEKIFGFIKTKKSVAPKEIIGFIGFGAPAVFRQLKKLQNKKLIIKTGKPPRVFYCLNMNKKDSQYQDALCWATEKKPGQLSSDIFCQTRDVFQVRVDHALRDAIRVTKDENLSHVLSAIAGEIGNNSFDHNLGNWSDIMGIYFKIDFENRIILLADRGQGLLATIHRVRPDIIDDIGAIRVAFTEVISGRAPEKRGNGLKFVRDMIKTNNMKLKFYSGTALCYIYSGNILFSVLDRSIPGTVAIIEF